MTRRRTVGVIGQFQAGSRLANAINVVKTAGGFSRLGHRVLVLCQAPGDGQSLAQLAAEYGEPRLEWRFAPPGLAPVNGDPSLGFAHWAADECEDACVDLVYARHFHGGLVAARRGLHAVVETHAHLGDLNPMLDRVFMATRTPEDRGRCLEAIVTISPRLRDHYIERGAARDRVFVVPDGVDTEMFTRPAYLPTCPPALLTDRSPRVVYAGHLYEYKGITTVLQAAARMPRASFVLVGGLDEDVRRVRDQAASMNLNNVELVGSIPHSRVPDYLWHADVLLLPPSATHPSAAWTSPVKLGEYLAAGRPVVASYIPALRDWVDEPAVRWFTPDDAASMVDSIVAAVTENTWQRASRLEVTSRLAQRLSYASRASAILTSVTPAGSPEFARAA